MTFTHFIPSAWNTPFPHVSLAHALFTSFKCLLSFHLFTGCALATPVVPGPDRPPYWHPLFPSPCLLSLPPHISRHPLRTYVFMFIIYFSLPMRLKLCKAATFIYFISNVSQVPTCRDQNCHSVTVCRSVNGWNQVGWCPQLSPYQGRTATCHLLVPRGSPTHSLSASASPSVWECSRWRESSGWPGSGCTVRSRGWHRALGLVGDRRLQIGNQDRGEVRRTGAQGEVDVGSKAKSPCEG